MDKIILDVIKELLRRRVVASHFVEKVPILDKDDKQKIKRSERKSRTSAIDILLDTLSEKCHQKGDNLHEVLNIVSEALPSEYDQERDMIQKMVEMKNCNHPFFKLMQLIEDLDSLQLYDWIMELHRHGIPIDKDSLIQELQEFDDPQATLPVLIYQVSQAINDTTREAFLKSITLDDVRHKVELSLDEGKISTDNNEIEKLYMKHKQFLYKSLFPNEMTVEMPSIFSQGGNDCAMRIADLVNRRHYNDAVNLFFKELLKSKEQGKLQFFKTALSNTESPLVYGVLFENYEIEPENTKDLLDLFPQLRDIRLDEIGFLRQLQDRKCLTPYDVTDIERYYKASRDIGLSEFSKRVCSRHPQWRDNLVDVLLNSPYKRFAQLLDPDYCENRHCTKASSSASSTRDSGVHHQSPSNPFLSSLKKYDFSAWVDHGKLRDQTSNSPAPGSTVSSSNNQSASITMTSGMREHNPITTEHIQSSPAGRSCVSGVSVDHRSTPPQAQGNKTPSSGSTKHTSTPPGYVESRDVRERDSAPPSYEESINDQSVSTGYSSTSFSSGTTGASGSELGASGSDSSLSTAGLPKLSALLNQTLHLEEDGACAPVDAGTRRMNLKLRGYQEELATFALEGYNSVICAPTGSGKTIVAAAIVQDHLSKGRRGSRKVLFLVDKVALVNQQSDLFKQYFRGKYEITKMSGEDGNNRMPLKMQLEEHDLFFMTAQILLDALDNADDIDSLSEFSLMIIDECHHTDKSHPYNRIMSYYIEEKFGEGEIAQLLCTKKLPQVVGMTASLGTGKATKTQKAIDHILNICANLDAQRICTVQNEVNKAELMHHVSNPSERTERVRGRTDCLFTDLVSDCMVKIETSLQDPLRQRSQEFVFLKPYLRAPSDKGTPTYIQWHSELCNQVVQIRDKDLRRFFYSSIKHLRLYNDSLIINNDCRTKDALAFLEKEFEAPDDDLADETEDDLLASWFEIKQEVLRDRSLQYDRNPKLSRLKEIILEENGRKDNARGILFCQTRYLTVALQNWMFDDPSLKELNPERFVGANASNDQQGITQKQQADTLYLFRCGHHKLIIATTVAEEGIDISECNYVIRYDHVTNEIALVQARGRGRAKDSRYIVIAQEGKGVAEKEQTNKMREKLQNEAIVKIIKEKGQNNWEKFEEDIKYLQERNAIDRKVQKRNRQGGKPRKRNPDNFYLLCMKCDEYACKAGDIRKIESAHHVVLEREFRNKCKFIPKPKPELDTEDPETNLTGKLTCKKCGMEWGGIRLFQKHPLSVMKISSFVIVDPDDCRGLKKQWKEVPFHVMPMQSKDWRMIL